MLNFMKFGPQEMHFLDSRGSGGQKYFVKPDFSEISFNPITTVHLNYEFLNP